MSRPNRAADVVQRPPGAPLRIAARSSGVGAFPGGGAKGITIGKARRGKLSDPLPGEAYVGRLELLCWCAPLPCHAEVIRSALTWLAEQQR